MSRTCRFYDDTGEHRFEESCFPITIGGDGSDISLPSASISDGRAYVDFSDGHPFVQPDKLSRVFLNRKKLTQSAWLNDGDIIKLGHSAVRCETDLQQVAFRLITHDDEKKPVLDPPSVSLRRTTEVSVEPSVTKKQTAKGIGRNKQKNGLRSFFLVPLFFVLLVLVGFVFSATPVVIEVMPEPDHLEMEGAVWTVKLGNHFLAWPGEYRVQAKRKGYIPLDKRVTIGNSSTESFNYAMEKLGGILMLTSSPVQQAEVFIDDRKIGKTPLSNILVSPGLHRIVLTHPRYKDHLQEIEVEGESKKQRIDVRLAPDWAEVEIQSIPPASVVKIDGEDRGVTPVKLELLSGMRRIRLEMAGFEHWENEIEITAEKDLKLPVVKLSKASGYLELTTRPKGASVVVGEQFRGRTPIKLKLKPNRKHAITLYKPGYAEVKRTVELDSGMQDQLSLNLIAEYGEIQLMGVPRDASVVIDGKEKNSATNEFKLSTRDHKLEVRKKGFKTFKKTVTPRKGLSQQISVNLVPLAGSAETAKAQKAGKSSMVFVKPGRFKMGASRREQGRRSNEVLHEVQLTRPFYIAKREVTNAEFRRFKPDHVSGSSQGLSLNGNRHPVVNVSWDDAARYSNWLSEQHNLESVYVEKGGRMVSRTPLPNGYRLPTEAEWAWAARASGRSSPLKYPWGQNYPAPSNRGNYAAGDSYVITAPVASFKSSRLGLFDIGGNVSEWMHDYYSVFTGFDNQLITDPKGPDQGKHHVVRGSSWRHGSIAELRLSYRDYAVKPRDDLGFRVARNAE